MVDDEQLEWVVACIAPWALAPHPNFAASKITGPGEFAQILLGRSGDRNQFKGEYAATPWVSNLLKSTEESLYSHTQASASSSLRQLLSPGAAPLGIQVAAALVICTIESDGDKSIAAIHSLLDLVDSLEERWRTIPAPTSPLYRPEYLAARSATSFALVVLHQQLALRHADINDFSASQAHYRRSSSLIRHTTFSVICNEVSLSEAYLGGWKQLRTDVRYQLQTVAISGLSATEDFRGRTWERTIKRRSGWVNSKFVGETAAARESTIKQLFENKFDSSSRRQRFGRSSSAINGWLNLRVAEMSGSIWSARRARRDLALDMLLANEAIEPFIASECLKLLRRSQSTKEVKVLTRWLRKRGPLDALRADATVIADRVRADSAPLLVEDFNVIRLAADLLSQADQRNLASAVWRALEDGYFNERAGWSYLEEALFALATLEQWTGDSDATARRLLNHLNRLAIAGQPIEAAVAQLIMSISWSAVDSGVRANISSWFSEHIEILDDWQRVFDAAEYSQLYTVESRSPLDLHSVVRLLDSKEALFDSRHQEASAFLIHQLSIVQSQAQAGTSSFGTYDEAEVAVAFAITFPTSNLWEAIFALLIDPLVSRSKKNAALTKLASESSKWPEATLHKLRRDWDAVRTSRSDDFAKSRGQSAEWSEWLIAGAAISALSSAEALRHVTTLQNSGAKDRVTAAAIASSAAYSETEAPVWALVSLLQLSNDDDPDVAATAAKGLAAGIDHIAFGDVISQRLVELLRSPSAQLPVAVLQGLQDHVQTRQFSTVLAHVISEMARRHDSQLVRRQCERLIKGLPRRKKQ